MRVFLDTSVLVSAAATRGICEDVLREVLSTHDLVVSEYLLTELQRVLTERIGAPEETSDKFQRLLRQDAQRVAWQNALVPGLRDTDDEPIVGAALEGRADVLVTGDKELLRVAHTGELRILSPRQFWEVIKAQASMSADD